MLLKFNIWGALKFLFSLTLISKITSEIYPSSTAYVEILASQRLTIQPSNGYKKSVCLEIQLHYC